MCQPGSFRPSYLVSHPKKVEEHQIRTTVAISLLLAYLSKSLFPAEMDGRRSRVQIWMCASCLMATQKKKVASRHDTNRSPGRPLIVRRWRFRTLQALWTRRREGRRASFGWAGGRTGWQPRALLSLPPSVAGWRFPKPPKAARLAGCTKAHTRFALSLLPPAGRDATQNLASKKKQGRQAGCGRKEVATNKTL